MGLFLCDLCNEHLGLSSKGLTPHVCDPETLRKRVRQLEDAARTAERRLDEIQNAVFMVLQELPSLEGEQVAVSGAWLRRLWDAARCVWYHAETPDNFLSRWLVKGFVLSRAYALFRKKGGKTLLDKLVGLRQACDESRPVLGYENSPFDLSPEDLVP